MRHQFHHPAVTVRFWRSLAKKALQAGHPTPCYIFSVEPLKEALRELDDAFGQLPIRHWLSGKTQPLRPMWQWWQRLGRPIEVVSEFEFRAALAEGFTAERILANGPAKHRWLPACAVAGLWVNFDSVNEIKALAPLAKKLKWRVGLRLRTGEEYDPETPEFPTQFGLGPEEVGEALKILKRHKLPVEVLHFHLRTNVAGAANYRKALVEVRAVCAQYSLAPRYIDCGGGFPPEQVIGFGGEFVDENFSLREMAKLYAEVLQWFPSCEGIWLENGRWFSARSGVLVVTVLDEKMSRLRTGAENSDIAGEGKFLRDTVPRSIRNLICDGGRTMNALVSNWEAHELLSLPERKGRKIMTTVNGPTCMAFDKLARRPMPVSIRVGDRLLWLEAGAYHLPWETRFSHGLAEVLWHDGKKLVQVRGQEEFGAWWRV
jgi:diaminopimelate decarboxylase